MAREMYAFMDVVESVDSNWFVPSLFAFSFVHISRHGVDESPTELGEKKRREGLLASWTPAGVRLMVVGGDAGNKKMEGASTDLYASLGVRKDASAAEIRKAYQR